MTAHGGRFLQCNGASGSVRIDGEERDSQTTEITPSTVNRGANWMRLHEACRMDTGTHTHTHIQYTHTTTTTNVMAAPWMPTRGIWSHFPSTTPQRSCFYRNNKKWLTGSERGHKWPMCVHPRKLPYTSWLRQWLNVPVKRAHHVGHTHVNRHLLHRRNQYCMMT